MALFFLFIGIYCYFTLGHVMSCKISFSALVIKKKLDVDCRFY